MATVTFKTIDANTPGFLRRQMQGVKLQAALARIGRQTADLQKAGVSPNDERFSAVAEAAVAAFDEMAAYLAAHIQEPADPAAARAAVEEMSESELSAALAAVMAGGAPPPLA